ncbi:MAG: efflux RND transporter periplasmic adaptor subunit [Dysgonamonadaceae bacterium]|jgi:RND family efflux transporter MFP subunit|nr:efflux RND transporter periplasmic adaptor subunit [Dysgonamonadaceae bacterium]
MTKKWFLSAAALTAICLCSSCYKEKGTQMQERVIPVKVITAGAGCALPLKQSYIGTVEESVAIALSFNGMGTVERAIVAEGQQVTKGQLLATLNTASAQNSYDVAQAKLAQAQDAYDRLAKVHANGSLADVKFVEIETGLQQAKSMVAMTKKSLDDCRLYAPQNGVIASRNIEVGANVMPGVETFKLVSVDKVFVKISVPENEIGSISEGLKANVTVPALNNAVFTGKIEQKGVEANALSHTYEAKIAITNPQKTLMPGMVCKVRLENLQLRKSEIVVPNHAIQISADNKHFVWLAKNNVAKRQFIETGNLTDNGVVVASGLSAGDKVITEGASKISEGTRLNGDF